MEQKEFMPVRDSCVFYAQTFNAFETLPTAERRDEAYRLLFRYIFFEEMPESDNPLIKALIMGLMPAYDAAAVRYSKAVIAGNKGGRPHKIDYDLVFDLKNKGYSYPDIAAEAECSISAVRRILSGTDNNSDINRDSNSVTKDSNRDSNSVTKDNNRDNNAHNPNVNVNDTVTVNETETDTVNANENKNDTEHETATEHETDNIKQRASLLPKRDLKSIRKPEKKDVPKEAEKPVDYLRLLTTEISGISDYQNTDKVYELIKAELQKADIKDEYAFEIFSDNKKEYITDIINKNLKANRAVTYIIKAIVERCKEFEADDIPF